ncbi:MAG: DUF58 domain-containing protein [Clostridia bacterium]|nr:DUF58 domain-containing protein [Clostridia bacterium]
MKLLALSLTDTTFIIAAVLPAFVFILLTAVFFHYLKMKLIGKLEYKREFSESDARAGDEVFIIETLRNPTPFPMFFVDVASYIDGSLKIKGLSSQDGMQLVISRFHLPPFSVVTKRHRVECSKRGYFEMKSAAVLHKKKTLEYSTTFSVDSCLFVYPTKLTAAEARSLINYSQGDYRSLNRYIFDPFSVVGVRDYAYGDPFSQINFKASAKCAYRPYNALKVNRLENCSDKVMMIFLNFTRPDGMEDTKEYEALMERSISLCSYLIEKAGENGHRVGFAANCKSPSGDARTLFPVLAGDAHVAQILRALASIRPDSASAFLPLVGNDSLAGLSMAEVYIVSAVTDNQTNAAYEALCRRNVVEVISP